MRRQGLKLLVVMTVVIALLAAAGGAAAADTTKARPFHFVEQADFHVVGECAPGVPLHQITGTGIGTHVGLVSIAGRGCAGEPGVVTWTTANGDEITIVFVSVVLAPPGEDGSAPVELYALEATGTGRFEDVQLGDDPMSGTIWFDADGGGHLETEVNSTIVYDASDRSS